MPQKTKPMAHHFLNSVAAAKWLIAATLCTFAMTGNAQVRVDVSGVGANQFPVAIATFSGDSQLAASLKSVMSNDLVRSGSFKTIDAPNGLSENSAINFNELKASGADAVLAGSINKLSDGRFDIRYRLSDTAKETSLLGESKIVTSADMRLAAHQIADSVYERLTGEKGIFSTRIAFISKQANRYKLNIGDWDGDNIQVALNSPEPIISPKWSFDGRKLAYVSFENKKPVVYSHNINGGQRQVMANFKGSNSAPAWSPDGRTLAVTLTQDGLSQIYLVTGEGNAKRLTQSTSIDTEPVYSPDGKTIFFTSDRGGSPQIYRIPSAGGEASRVTFGGTYNVSPRLSPDGSRLVFITRREGRFLVAVKDLSGGAEQIVSDTGREESPSYAPNGKWILYATQSNGKDSLIAVSSDGRIKQRLTSSADIREPSWGPFLK
jgi:TolB protein